MENMKETKVVDLLERDGIVTTKESTENKKKPYTLRKLSAKDISLMLKIVKKIDMKKFKNVFTEIDISEIVNVATESQMQESQMQDSQMQDSQMQEREDTIEEIREDNTGLMAKIGGALIFEAIPLVLDALDNCIGDVNKLLASVANMELSDLENLDLDIYLNLIYDFITKQEFAGFMKVVSKFLKSEN